LIDTLSESTELSSDGKDVSIDTLSESTASSSSGMNSEDVVANSKEVLDDAFVPFLGFVHRFAIGDCLLFVSKDVSSNAKLKSRQSARLAFALTEEIPQEETHFLKELRSALDYLSTISLLLM
jgi:hypothetical protein